MSATAIPPDDPARPLAPADPDEPGLRHLAVVGDTFTRMLRAVAVAPRYGVEKL